MTADNFVKIVRGGSEKLRVDEVAIHTGLLEVHGKGLMQIGQDEIKLVVTINKGEELPEAKTGIFTKSEGWKLSGLIEDELRFRCDYVGPTGNESRSWPAGVTRRTFRLHPIELIPTGWDALSRAERKAQMKQLEQQHQISAADTDRVPEPDKTDDFCFQAVLRGYPLAAFGEVSGQTAHYEFTLKKEGEGADLQVTLRSSSDYHSSGKEEDWNHFYGFMKALAFAHGMNAWPYRTEYWRAGQKISDRVTAANKLAKTAHAPFTERLSFNAKTGQLTWDVQTPLRLAADFFSADSTLSKEVSEILFLFREADEGVHSEITTIALCSLFENLVRLIFRELNLRDQAPSDLRLFEEAKSEVVDHISRHIPNNGDGYKRLHNIVRSAQLFHIDQMFRAVTDHFKLKWEGDMEAVLNTWKRARHPIVHDKSRADTSEADLKRSITDESRIAGAINILVLKLIGYSGWVRSSTFEDGYREI